MAIDPNEERLLTVNDVAERLQLHPITVRRHIKAGKLRAVRVGRAVRVRESDLETYLDVEGDGWVEPDKETKEELLKEYYRLLDRIHIELPYNWPPTPEEIARRQKLTEETFRRRDERGPIGITTQELVRQGRRERDEKYDRTSGISRRRVRRRKMASDGRESYGGSQ